ncbi:hypothetical protein JAAARDRAFT_198552 [Jaapia argillacea MUCL 33604]|uniref:Uncharacterized protein n=1 Tax=Jaapia argillacea MUCL 33604 TaxID=933084 RepID=A0A067PP86_9AGAM|nr:hypothetical protein JAAARDRAFT_198552 [Jaapia argillacea MUCL 33604]
MDVALLNFLCFWKRDYRKGFTQLSKRPFSLKLCLWLLAVFMVFSLFYYVSDDLTTLLDANTRNVALNKAQATAAKGLQVIAMVHRHGSVDPI